MTEAAYQSQMRATAARHGLWLFRNNVGACIDRTGRRITYGLMPGSADCIGWMPYTVQPGDVGRLLAVFVSVEFKSEKGVLRPDQRVWLEQVQRAGGLAAVARPPMDWADVLDGWQQST